MEGLSSEQITKLQHQFGKNEITTKESFSALHLFLSQFPTSINAILCVAAIFSFLIHEPIDALLIIIILFLNALLGFFQEFRAEKALEKLKALAQPTCIVKRNGSTQEISVIELVPGDIVILEEGGRLPADGIILNATHLEIDESILTGESLPVIKNNQDEAFSGTFIARGKGHLQITKIGDTTKLGQITTSLANVEEEATPLEKQISKLAKLLSFGAIGIAALLIPIGIFEKVEVYPLLLLVITLAVAAIPESLPAVITIALSIGTSRMAAKKAIVRKLSSIETIGAVQVILTDKTGTLTQGEMRVKEYYCPKDSDVHLLTHASTVGNASHIINENGKTSIIGDSTDGALLLWATETSKQTNHTLSDTKILDEYTFDPLTKTITTIAEIHEKTTIVVRGAPESILKTCKITQEENSKFTEKFESFAKEGYRVIALAQKHTTDHTKLAKKDLEKDLNFLGFLCLYDPPREEVKEAVKTTQNAGITIIMVTGDNPLTARKIAEEVGILDGNKTVLTGEDVERLSEEELQKAVQEVRVFARTTPEHKLKLTQTLQKLGFVVGVTGDGVNDALALKQANVGLSMGQKGTDVAREASDIVLSDDNFATITAAIFEGRKIYANIVNAITYLVTGNLAEMLVIFLASIFFLPFPLLPTQILWINLVTDGLPALALATDKGGSYLLTKKPRRKEEPILTRKRLIFVFAAGLLLASIIVGMFVYVDDFYSLSQARTLVFTLLVVLEMILAIVIRGKQIFSNKFFYFSIFITLLLQLIITIVPFFQNIFHLSL